MQPSARLVYVTVLLLATAATAGVAAWVSRRAEGRAADLFVLAMLFAAVHGGLGVVQVLLSDPARSEVVEAARFVPLWAGVVANAGFVAHYVGRESMLTRRRRLALVGVAAVGSAVELTNPLHGLVFRDVEVVSTPFPHLASEPTALFWVISGSAYLVILWAVGLLVVSLLTSRRVGRRQVLFLSAGIVPSVAVHAGQYAGVLPARGLDYTPVAVAGFAVVVGYALANERLFAFNPVSRAAVIESVTDAVVALDAERRIVDFNAAAERLGVDETDIGAPVDGVLPGVTSETTDPAETPDTPDAAAVSPDASPDDFAERFVDRSSGERRVYVVQPSTVGDPERPDGYVVVLRDVTAVEAYAAKLERQTEHLDRFAATVSHDMRNPLSVARGYVETTIETGDLSHLSKAVTALDRVEEIVDDSLTLAREGRVIEDTETTALATMAQDAWAAVDTGTATLAVETDRTVAADAGRLSTLFENLFRNAVEHGGATVVRVTDHRDGFAVADDGTGIPHEDLDVVFERGYTTSADGTGLGLAIVRSIATAHGWSVGIEESDAGGARVTFTGVTVGPDEETVSGGGDGDGQAGSTERSDAGWITADPADDAGED